MILWFEIKKDQEIIINGYNAEIKAVRYTQIIDDDRYWKIVYIVTGMR